MTPKEKAADLVAKFKMFACWGLFEDEYEAQQNAKQCALIAVDQILNMDNPICESTEADKFYDYWQEVKNEIEKL